MTVGDVLVMVMRVGKVLVIVMVKGLEGGGW